MLLRSALRIPSITLCSAQSRLLHCAPVVRDNKINDLMAQFKNPKSPFYLSQATGEVGPASPDDHTVSRPLPGQEERAAGWTAPRPQVFDDAQLMPSTPEYDRARATGHEWFDSNGFDVRGRLEMPVQWGDSDMFQHVNNVVYVKWLEANRMRWIATLADDMGTALTQDWLKGREQGFIVKDQALRYRRPVTWPDAVIWAAKPHHIDPKRGEFKLSHAVWSIKDNCLVATGDTTLVCYDYNHNKRGKMSDLVHKVLEHRAKL